MNQKRANFTTPRLSVDSLVDIFMNAFAIVMFSSIALALSLGPQKKMALEEAPERNNQKRTVKLRLPETRDVSTNPVFIWMRPDGVKIINENPRLEQLTTNQMKLTDQIQVDPISNVSISLDEARDLAGQINITKNHVIFLVHPGGVKYFKQFREIFEQSGVPSGWIPYSKDVVFLGSSGRSPREVQ
jgi:hypothetical protein